jgi:hypothetical protein
VQITWLAPARLMAAPGQEPKPALRANLVLSLVPAQVETPAEAREQFLRDTAAAVPDYQEVERADVAFDDGMAGSLVAVEFRPANDVTLRQRHFFRIDDGMLVQLVATVDAEASDEEDMLHAAALSYKPVTS